MNARSLAVRLAKLEQSAGLTDGLTVIIRRFGKPGQLIGFERNGRLYRLKHRQSHDDLITEVKAIERPTNGLLLLHEAFE